MKILRFEELDSTNTYAKTLLKSGESAVIVAERQTGGRGTKGRSFVSNEGGVYLTKLDFHDGFPAKDAFKIMACAAVAVCKTLERFSFSPVIKWANDVHVNGKKICGILIENVFSGANIAASIVGIGLNVNNVLHEELRAIAVSMREAAGKPFDKSEVEAALIEELNGAFSVSDYLSRVGYLNREITLLEGGERNPAYAISVTERGELVVEQGGKIRTVTAAEVSLRLD